MGDSSKQPSSSSSKQPEKNSSTPIGAEHHSSPSRRPEQHTLPPNQTAMHYSPASRWSQENSRSQIPPHSHTIRRRSPCESQDGNRDSAIPAEHCPLMGSASSFTNHAVMNHVHSSPVFDVHPNQVLPSMNFYRDHTNSFPDSGPTGEMSPILSYNHATNRLSSPPENLSPIVHDQWYPSRPSVVPSFNIDNATSPREQLATPTFSNHQSHCQDFNRRREPLGVSHDRSNATAATFPIGITNSSFSSSQIMESMPLNSNIPYQRQQDNWNRQSHSNLTNALRGPVMRGATSHTTQAMLNRTPISHLSQCYHRRNWGNQRRDSYEDRYLSSLDYPTIENSNGPDRAGNQYLQPLSSSHMRFGQNSSTPCPSSSVHRPHVIARRTRENSSSDRYMLSQARSMNSTTPRWSPRPHASSNQTTERLPLILPRRDLTTDGLQRTNEPQQGFKNKSKQFKTRAVSNEAKRGVERTCRSISEGPVNFDSYHPREGRVEIQQVSGRSERSQMGRSTCDRAQGDRSNSEQAQENRPNSERAQENRSNSERAQENRSNSERAQENRSNSERAQENRPNSERAQENRSNYVRGQGNRSNSVQVQGDRLYSERTYRNRSNQSLQPSQNSRNSSQLQRYSNRKFARQKGPCSSHAVRSHDWERYERHATFHRIVQSIRCHIDRQRCPPSDLSDMKNTPHRRRPSKHNQRSNEHYACEPHCRHPHATKSSSVFLEENQHDGIHRDNSSGNRSSSRYRQNEYRRCTSHNGTRRNESEASLRSTQVSYSRNNSTTQRFLLRPSEDTVNSESHDQPQISIPLPLFFYRRRTTESNHSGRLHQINNFQGRIIYRHNSDVTRRMPHNGTETSTSRSRLNDMLEETLRHQCSTLNDVLDQGTRRPVDTRELLDARYELLLSNFFRPLVSPLDYLIRRSGFMDLQWQPCTSSSALLKRFHALLDEAFSPSFSSVESNLRIISELFDSRYRPSYNSLNRAYSKVCQTMDKLARGHSVGDTERGAPNFEAHHMAHHRIIPPSLRPHEARGSSAEFSVQCPEPEITRDSYKSPNLDSAQEETIDRDDGNKSQLSPIHSSQVNVRHDPVDSDSRAFSDQVIANGADLSIELDRTQVQSRGGISSEKINNSNIRPSQSNRTDSSASHPKPVRNSHRNVRARSSPKQSTVQDKNAKHGDGRTSSSQSSRLPQTKPVQSETVTVRGTKEAQNGSDEFEDCQGSKDKTQPRNPCRCQCLQKNAKYVSSYKYFKASNQWVQTVRSPCSSVVRSNSNKHGCSILYHQAQNGHVDIFVLRASGETTVLCFEDIDRIRVFHQATSGAMIELTSHVNGNVDPDHWGNLSSAAEMINKYRQKRK